MSKFNIGDEVIIIEDNNELKSVSVHSGMTGVITTCPDDPEGFYDVKFPAAAAGCTTSVGIYAREMELLSEYHQFPQLEPADINIEEILGVV